MENHKRILISALSKITDIKNERLKILEALSQSIEKDNFSEILDNAYKLCGKQRKLSSNEHLIYKLHKDYIVPLSEKIKTPMEILLISGNKSFVSFKTVEQNNEKN